MDDLFSKLIAGTKARKSIPWPGTDVEVEIRVANDQDRFEAGIATDKLFSELGIRIGSENVYSYEAEKATQLLWRVVMKPGTDSRVTENITEFRALLRDGVREKLAEAHTSFQQECSPDPYEMTDQEFDVLYARVKKNAPAILSKESSIFTLRKLAHTLVEELSSSQRDSG